MVIFSIEISLTVTILVITIITNNIPSTQASSHSSLVNTTVTHEGQEVLRVEQIRYSRKYNTHFNDAKIQWSYLYTATSPISVTLCSSLCMDHPECVSFFYNKNLGVIPNCFLNNQGLRPDHYKQVNGMDYFELPNDCTRNPDRCKDNGVCIANYTSGGSSCAKTHITGLQHTSLFEPHKNGCITDPVDFQVIYKLYHNGDFLKSFNAWAFKLDIPKSATILKAILDCTIRDQDGKPEYTVRFGYASPSQPLSFLQTCQYKDISKLESTSVPWDLFLLNIEVGAIVSTNDELMILLQEFVNHAAYTPGIFFQLVLFEESLPDFQTSQKRFRCHGSSDRGKSPKFHVEWSYR